MSPHDWPHWADQLEQRDTRDELVELAVKIGELRPALPALDTEFKKKLRAQLLADHPAQRPVLMRSIHFHVRLAAVFLVVLLALLFLSPQVRTLAQDVIRQIGDLRISNESTDFEQIAAGEITLDRDQHLPSYQVTSSVQTIEEATELAGFPVYFPACPIGQYVCLQHEVNINEESTVVATYLLRSAGDLADDSGSGGITALPGGIVVVSQIAYRTPPAEPLRISNASVQDVLIQGEYAGIWVENNPMALYFGAQDPESQDEPPELGYGSSLIWEQDAYVFMISSMDLTLADALMIAETMATVSP